MARAFGIVNSSGNHMWVEGLQEYRPIGAFSFLGRYRAVDFPISNMTNSGIDRIQVYVRKQPRSIVEHLGTGRHYNINSKRGKLQLLFSENQSETDIYNTDIAAYYENLESIQEMTEPYVVITPSYMICTMNYKDLLKTHIDSGADVTLAYHEVDNADTAFLNCDYLNIDRHGHVFGFGKNTGNAKQRDIFMDTYVMKTELFVELIEKAKKISSIYTLAQVVDAVRDRLDVRGVQHSGFFAALTDFNSYFNANLSLIDYKTANTLFLENWPIYTRTHDSCPTQYFETADVKNSVVSDGCLIEGTIVDSVIGRACEIKEGAVIKNCVILPGVTIGEGVHLENQLVDKHAKVLLAKEVISTPEKPGYIKRRDTI